VKPVSLLSATELLRACLDEGSPEFWEEFIRRFEPLILAVVVRTARRYGIQAQAEYQDLLQETYLKMCADRCRALRAFAPQHPDSVFAFLKVLTANVVHDRCQARAAWRRDYNREVALDHRLDLLTDEPAADWAVLLREVDQALQANLSGDKQKRDRIVFWLYYRQGFTSRAIADLPSVQLTQKGVESLLHRLAGMVRSTLEGTKGKAAQAPSYKETAP
jgi:RNA polymerase sigma-70 factor (ECF subfamily)